MRKQEATGDSCQQLLVTLNPPVPLKLLVEIGVHWLKGVAMLVEVSTMKVPLPTPLVPLKMILPPAVVTELITGGGGITTRFKLPPLTTSEVIAPAATPLPVTVTVAFGVPEIEPAACLMSK